MDKTALVGLDIEAGSRVVSVLEKSGTPLKVALWMMTPDYEDGVLVLASHALDKESPLKAYDHVAEILHGEFVSPPPPILILRMKDPFIQKLRDLFAMTKSVSAMRLGGQKIANRVILDAYVYKIK